MLKKTFFTIALGLTLSLCRFSGHFNWSDSLAWPRLLKPGLPPGNALTDGAALLRYSLPIDNPEIRQVQGELEGLSEWLRSKRFGPIKKRHYKGRANF